MTNRDIADAILKEIKQGNPPPLVGIGACADPIPMQVTDSSAKEIFRITAEGEIEADGKVITNDDAAIGECLREAAKVLVKGQTPESDDIDEGFDRYECGNLE